MSAVWRGLALPLLVASSTTARAQEDRDRDIFGAPTASATTAIDRPSEESIFEQPKSEPVDRQVEEAFGDPSRTAPNVLDERLDEHQDKLALGALLYLR